MSEASRFFSGISFSCNLMTKNAIMPGFREKAPDASLPVSTIVYSKYIFYLFLKHYIHCILLKLLTYINARQILMEHVARFLASP